MQFDAELLLFAMAPVFLAHIGWETCHLHRARPAAGLYSRRNTLRNASLALLQQVAGKIAWLAIIPFYAFVYDHYRLFTWQTGWLPFVMLLVALPAPLIWAGADHARHADSGASIGDKKNSADAFRHSRAERKTL